ncbi:uncharacterized protein LOC135239463 isoform X2 [Anguilla rostrata]|uniref:uncharacterized protein LOC135239463 isoform X2 n=1 Tax=Anguilla rostrata TaxID=7938 RepID=UPI0030D37D94
MRRLQTPAAPSHPPPPFPTPPSPCLSTFSPLTDSDVSQLLLSHRPTTCALDPIPSSLLQTITPDILPFVTSLVNSSLSSGCFPSSFKLAHVTPLLKKPTLDPSIIQNNRPVSLLPFLSKTIERAASNQLSSFLLQNNLLDPHQSGFRPGHSTETALLSVSAHISACLRDIQSWMDNHHLKLNPGDTLVSSSPTAKNLGVVMNNRLSLSQNIAAVCLTCKFFLYNIRRIHPFLTTYATQLLVQAMVLSRLDYCNSLLAGLPASAIRPLQLIQNAAARLVYNLPRHSHVSPPAH